MAGVDLVIVDREDLQSVLVWIRKSGVIQQSPRQAVGRLEEQAKADAIVAVRRNPFDDRGENMSERTYEIIVRVDVDDDLSPVDLINQMMEGMDGWSASYNDVTDAAVVTDGLPPIDVIAADYEGDGRD